LYDLGFACGMTPPAPAIRLTGLTKSFGAVHAVAGLDLDIAEGEFFSMLGPSGSGKTTVLRLIAGFEQPTSGTIELRGHNVTASAPFERDVNTVFQDYALFPHMSVIDNVAYGLRVRGVRRADRMTRAREALDGVQLADYANRKPSELSGGQRQRVALARATVVRPKVLLLDEPLGALDLKLREQMQVELKELQRSLGITFIFVTHDQEEALTLSDRIAIFNAGRIVQLGTPAEIYENPTTAFVAGFVGTSNIFEPDLSRTLMHLEGLTAVRPERITLTADTRGGGAGGDAPGSGDYRAPGTIAEVIYLGTSARILVDLDGGKRITVLEHRGSTGDDTAASAGTGTVGFGDRRGERVVAQWSQSAVVVLDAASSTPSTPSTPASPVPTAASDHAP
jgi:putative spermidine/putrescine transport system ATP-binding protein